MVQKIRWRGYVGVAVHRHDADRRCDERSVGRSAGLGGSVSRGGLTFKQAVRALAPVLALAASACSSVGTRPQQQSLTPAASTASHYGSKTPYPCVSSERHYEPAPAGFALVHTQLLARHGSRGLTSPKADLLMHDLWRQAEAAGALTPLGRELGADILALMKANALLGYRVPEIGKPGYGNLTKAGIEEHQQLARRLYARDAGLFTQPGRVVEVFGSGRDRAVDSAAIFATTLLAIQPSLNMARGGPGGAPVVTVDRFRLYFHKLNREVDSEPPAGNPLRTTWLASLAYQASQQDARVEEKLDQAERDPAVKAAAHEVLLRLFAKDFVARLDAGQITADGAGSFEFSSADGQFHTTVSAQGGKAGKGIRYGVDAARALYELYCIAAGMRYELHSDFSRYMPAAQAEVFETLEDLDAFYEKGPSFAERGDVTWAMSQALFDDFFDQVDRIAAGDLRIAARLRFAHAEHVIPLISKLGLPGWSEQLPVATTYSHQRSGWHGSRVSTMAANIQWDTWRNAEGRLLVRMLHNENVTAFKASCDKARLAPGSGFYDYQALKSCYGR